MAPEVLLWDFGDTLVDERWMRRAPDGCPAWEAAWSDVMTVLADGWNVGTVRAGQVYEALAERTGMTAEAVEAHARDCCRSLRFHATAWRVATERRLPQALVTVNPDLFTEHIVAVHDLAAIFDVIVTSSEEKTDDKPALCQIALDRLGFRRERPKALLIDNRLDLVNAWRDVGGSGYWFQTDEQFGRDASRLFGLPDRTD